MVRIRQLKKSIDEIAAREAPSPENELTNRLQRFNLQLFVAQVRWLRTFRCIRIITLLLAATIPVVALALKEQLVTAILGAYIAVLTGINEILQPDQAVINLSRARGIIWENLMRYKDKVEPYKSGDSTELLSKAYLDSW